jgi:hypothetical protein
MYTLTFDRIHQQPKAQVQMAMTMVTWIHLAQKKLSVRAPQYALAVRPKDIAFCEDGIPSEKALLDCCLGPVVIETETLTIRLAHFTLQEYLDKNWQQLFPSGHLMIASTCLTYLHFNHPFFADRPNYRSYSSLLPYATNFVDHHLREETNSELDNRVLKLITDQEKLRLLRKNVGALKPLYHPCIWPPTSGSGPSSN